MNTYSSKDMLTVLLNEVYHCANKSEKLANYLTMQGVIAPPCPIHTTIYVISGIKGEGPEIYKDRVTSFIMRGMGLFFTTGRGACIPCDQFGETVFFEYHKAEEALGRYD